MILPSAYADDFRQFCQLNPKPCPLLAESRAGDFKLPSLGADIDIRTDIPLYRVWENGDVVSEVSDLKGFWREDLVTFVLGCSFSFEDALQLSGLDVRHISRGSNVPMYRTNIPCKAAGVFQGPMVVSMRPFKPADAIKAVQITSLFPRVHGAPVHIGFPRDIGIADLGVPDYGSAVPVLEGELPVFWACGVTPQSVVHAAKLPFCITHAPGHMLITDLLNSQLKSETISID